MTHLTTYTSATLPNPHEMDNALKLAQFAAQSGFFPAYKGRPQEAVMAILYGQSLGLAWGQSLLNITVINGRPTLWGDAMLAIVKASSDFEYCHETFDKANKMAICEVKRHGEAPQVRTFSYEQAQRAGLASKDNWRKYPERMLQMRARAFALRDVFPHLLNGIYMTEEMSGTSPLPPRQEPVPQPQTVIAVKEEEPTLETLETTEETDFAESPVTPEPQTPEKDEDKTADETLNDTSDGDAVQNASAKPDNLATLELARLRRQALQEQKLRKMTVNIERHLKRATS